MNSMNFIVFLDFKKLYNYEFDFILIKIFNKIL